MDVTEAVSFVEAQGSDLERARLSHILYGVQPAENAVSSFIGLQDPDGGFPFDMVATNLSAVSETLNALWALDGLGMLQSEPANRALAFLLASQKDDGGWDEDAALARYDLPPWISPGDLRTRLYLSAYSAYWLAVRRFNRRRPFRSALEFLLSHQEESGKFHGYLHTTWIATSVFLMAGRRYAPVAAQGLQFLMTRPLEEWADSQIAWALHCLGRAGLPKNHPFVEHCLAVLVQRQNQYGTWSSEDGEAHAVSATVAVLKALQHFGLLAVGH